VDLVKRKAINIKESSIGLGEAYEMVTALKGGLG